MGGGNLFINPIDFEDTTFTWFPLDSILTLNPNGRLRPGKKVICDFDTTLNLSVSHLIAVRVKGFWPDESEFAEIRGIYHMADPESGDSWQGNPTVCSIGRYRVSPTELSGKVVILTLPLHDGYRPKLNGNGSSIKFPGMLSIYIDAKDEDSENGQENNKLPTLNEKDKFICLHPKTPNYYFRKKKINNLNFQLRDSTKMNFLSAIDFLRKKKIKSVLLGEGFENLGNDFDNFVNFFGFS